MAKLTLENEFGIYSVETFETTDDIYQMFDYLVLPVLLAAGFHPDTVEDGWEKKLDEHKSVNDIKTNKE